MLLCIQIEQVLYHAVEQHVTDSQKDLERWLSANEEKADWCKDISGDKYSIEAKLSTVEVCTEYIYTLFLPFSTIACDGKTLIKQRVNILLEKFDWKCFSYEKYYSSLTKIHFWNSCKISYGFVFLLF